MTNGEYRIIKPLTMQVREYVSGRVPRSRLLLARQRVELGHRTDQIDGWVESQPKESKA